MEDKKISIFEKKSINKKIKKDNLSEDKIKSAINIVEFLHSKEKTMVAIEGERGSGKSSTISVSLKARFRTFNFFMKKIYWIFLFIISIFLFGRPKNKINNHMSNFSYKIININLWKVFPTFVSKSDLMNKEENESEKKTGSEKPSYQNEVKERLWTTIFFKIGKFKNTKKMLIKAGEHGNGDFKFNTINWPFILLITILPILFIVALVVLNISNKIADEISIALSVVSSIIPISGLTYMKVSGSGNFKERMLNAFSNSIISEILEDYSANKTIILHIEDLDRVDDKLVREIVDHLAILYTSKNLKIILEINKKVWDEISKEDLVDKNEHIEERNKKIQCHIKVKSLTKNELKRIYDPSKNKIKNYDLFINTFHNTLSNVNKLSFRFEKELMVSFEENMKLFEIQDNKYIIKKYLYKQISSLIVEEERNKQEDITLRLVDNKIYSNFAYKSNNPNTILKRVNFLNSSSDKYFEEIPVIIEDCDVANLLIEKGNSKVLLKNENNKILAETKKVIKKDEYLDFIGNNFNLFVETKVSEEGEEVNLNIKNEVIELLKNWVLVDKNIFNRINKKYKNVLANYISNNMSLNKFEDDLFTEIFKNTSRFEYINFESLSLKQQNLYFDEFKSDPSRYMAKHIDKVDIELAKTFLDNVLEDEESENEMIEIIFDKRPELFIDIFSSTHNELISDLIEKKTKLLKSVKIKNWYSHNLKLLLIKENKYIDELYNWLHSNNIEITSEIINNFIENSTIYQNVFLEDNFDELNTKDFYQINKKKIPLDIIDFRLWNWEISNEVNAKMFDNERFNTVKECYCNKDRIKKFKNFNSIYNTALKYMIIDEININYTIEELENEINNFDENWSKFIERNKDDLFIKNKKTLKVFEEILSFATKKYPPKYIAEVFGNSWTFSTILNINNTHWRKQPLYKELKKTIKESNIND